MEDMEHRVKRVVVWVLLLWGAIPIDQVKALEPICAPEVTMDVLQTPCQSPVEPWQSDSSSTLNLSTPENSAPLATTPKKETPEPTTIALLGLGAVVACSCRRRLRV